MMESHSVSIGDAQYTGPETMMHPVLRCDLRELRTALAAFDRAEYTGGRERAAAFLASAARNMLVNFTDPNA